MQSRETDELKIAISNLMIDDNSFDVKDTKARELIEKLNSDKVSAVEGKGLSTNDFTDEYRDLLTETAESLRIHRASISNPHKTTKKTIGLSNVENKDSETIRSEITKENVTHALGYTPISTENIGIPNGIPSLDKEGRIPSSQLPEYTPEKSLEDAKEYTRTYLTEVMNGGGDLNSWKAVTNAINENADDIQTLYNTTRLKVNTVPGKGLSTNDLTNELKEKYDEAVSQIELLTGDATVEGSISQKLVEIVAGAPEKYDTLKEIAEWIESDTDGAAKMQTDIKANKDNISKNSDNIDDIYQKLADNGYGQFAGGKNLFNPLNCESIFLETQNCYRFGQILSGLPSGKYTLSKSNTETALYWWTMSSSGSWGSQNSFKEKAIITINPGDSLGIRMGSGETSFDIHGDIQLEYGKVNTEFAPYYPSNLEINENSKSRDEYILEQISVNRENISDLDDRLEQCFQSVSDGKVTLATSLTNLGETTASDATFLEISSNIIQLAKDKYASGVFDTKKGTAVAEEVLSGKTFTNSSGVNLMGSMTNNKASTVTLNSSYTNYVIPKGFHSGNGNVRILAQSKSISPKIYPQTVTPDSGYILSEVTVNAVPLSGTAASGNVLEGKTFYATSLTASTGTMKNNGAISASLPINGTYTIPAGYHNGSGKVIQTIATKSSATYYATTSDQVINSGQYLTGNQIIKALSSNNLSSANIKSGTTISVNNGSTNVYSVVGSFTSSGTQSNGQAIAGTGQILRGYSAWANGKELKGTMDTISSGTWYIGVNGSYTIPAGYHDGNGRVTQSIATKSAATYTASTSDQVINSGQYLTGNQTIKAVTASLPDASAILFGSSVEVTSNGSNLAGVNGSAYPGMLLVAGGDANLLQYTTDGYNWKDLCTMTSTCNDLRFYSGLLWAATNAYSQSYNINGFSSSSTNFPNSGFVHSGLTCGEGKVIVVDSFDSAIYYTKPMFGSGVVRTSISLHDNPTFKSVYGHAGFVIIKEGSNSGYKVNSALTSIQYISFPITAYDVAYGNGIYVMVGGGGAYYSTDGVTWIAGSTDGSMKTGVTFGDGMFVAVGRDYKSQYSTDGVSWTSISGMGGQYMESVGYSGQYFIAGGWYYSYYTQVSTRQWVAMSNHKTGVCTAIAGI